MDESKLKVTGVITGLIAFAVVGLDFVVLKGETVASGSVGLRVDGDPMVFSISQPLEEHLVEISTRKRERGETRGRAISYRIVGPDGNTVLEDSEIVNRKKRFIEFVPLEAGEYTLHAEEVKLLGGERGRGYVDVTVNDRRILSRWMRF